MIDNTEILGVIIDDNLNWSLGIGIICRARKFFSKSALINLYYAFIFPYLIYCVEVWSNALSTQPLIKLQILISWPLLKNDIMKQVFYHLLR